MLVFGDAYLKLENGYDGTISLKTIDNKNVFHAFEDIEDEYGNFIKYDEYAIVNKE